jgi:alpha-galactosidase
MGFQKLGYHYVNMDSKWDTKNRDKDGNLVPDPQKWPNGLDDTISYVHGKGLGFGLYGDKGEKRSRHHSHSIFGWESERRTVTSEVEIFGSTVRERFWTVHCVV